MPHAAFYVVQLMALTVLLVVIGVSMPHAAFYVVQLRMEAHSAGRELFQCRTRLSMWCNCGI